MGEKEKKKEQYILLRMAICVSLLYYATIT